MSTPPLPNQSQLNRIEEKMDTLIQTSTENKTELKNHIKMDTWSYRALAVVVVFITTTHAVEAVEFLSKMI